jgi:hypothetical protein
MPVPTVRRADSEGGSRSQIGECCLQCLEPPLGVGRGARDRGCAEAAGDADCADDVAYDAGRGLRVPIEGVFLDEATPTAQGGFGLIVPTGGDPVRKQIRRPIVRDSEGPR